ncbi:MAG: hypothetical protein KGN78_08270 [Actinomycetales bacterium]|nr:hypothetical protein [Actinomycetales bacterium]
MFGIGTTLKVGAIVFGLSALLLLLLPGLFLDLLQLDGQSAALQWSMRMIGLTLIALAANMWLVSKSTSERTVTTAAVVMTVVAAGLGLLTLVIPAELGWFTIAYALVGFAFAASYLACLIRLASHHRKGS